MKFNRISALLQERYGEHSREVGPNHWMFEAMTGDQRSQVVHLIYRERSAQGQDVSRFVVDSPIGQLPKRYDLESLLRKNADLDVGAICVEDFRDEQGRLVPYITLRASHLIATADIEEVWEMVDIVARAADRLEKEIYASDKH